MIQGPINNSHNQRTISIALAFIIGAIMILGVVDWKYSIWGALTAGGAAGLLLFYIAIGLYKNWF